MQADMEIQRAAKLPVRHRRCARGTGARSSLNSPLCSSSACWRSVNSVWTALMVVRFYFSSETPAKASSHAKLRRTGGVNGNDGTKGRYGIGREWEWAFVGL